jgi:hypothetical protein
MSSQFYLVAIDWSGFLFYILETPEVLLASQLSESAKSVTWLTWLFCQPVLRIIYHNINLEM